MKFKYTGDQDAITLRGVTFKKGKAVGVDDPNFIEKLSGLPYFAPVKPNGKDKD